MVVNIRRWLLCLPRDNGLISDLSIWKHIDRSIPTCTRTNISLLYIYTTEKIKRNRTCYEKFECTTFPKAFQILHWLETNIQDKGVGIINYKKTTDHLHKSHSSKLWGILFQLHVEVVRSKCLLPIWRTKQCTNTQTGKVNTWKHDMGVSKL